MRWYYNVHYPKEMCTYVASSLEEAMNMDFQAAKAAKMTTATTAEEHAKTCNIDKFPWRDEFPSREEIEIHMRLLGGCWEARTQWYGGKPEIIQITEWRLSGRALALVSSTATYRPVDGQHKPCSWPTKKA